MLLEMSAVMYEVMLAFSRMLDQDYIDDSVTLTDIFEGRSQRQVMNRVVTVRGSLAGRSLVVSHHDYYFLSSSAHSAYLRGILDVFVAEPDMCFEGECRRRGAVDALARWFGGGGLRGAASVFYTRRVDGVASAGQDELEDLEFCRRLEELSGDEACVKVQLQREAGITALFRSASVTGSIDFLRARVSRCVALAERCAHSPRSAPSA